MPEVSRTHPDRPLLEACVTTAEQALAAWRGGADRVELCRELGIGGLTPALEELRRTRELVPVPVFAMLRRRGGTFALEQGELGCLLQEATGLLGAGADGLVFGALDSSGRVDRRALREVLAVADGRPLTFHRAFDASTNPEAALDALLECGATRVLSAGGPGRAWEQQDMLRRLVGRAGSGLIVLAGGGVRAAHAAALVAATGLGELHARAVAFPGLADAFAADPAS
jgi:copper homeostasis protein